MEVKNKIEKDEVLNIGNHLSMDVYANQEVKIGRDYSHQTSRNAVLLFIVIRVLCSGRA